MLERKVQTHMFCARAVHSV